MRISCRTCSQAVASLLRLCRPPSVPLPCVPDPHSYTGTGANEGRQNVEAGVTKDYPYAPGRHIAPPRQRNSGKEDASKRDVSIPHYPAQRPRSQHPTTPHPTPRATQNAIRQLQRTAIPSLRRDPCKCTHTCRHMRGSSPSRPCAFFRCIHHLCLGSLPC